MFAIGSDERKIIGRILDTCKTGEDWVTLLALVGGTLTAAFRAGASKSGRKERLASTLRRKAVRNPAASRLRRGRVPGTARSWTTRPGISLVV